MTFLLIIYCINLPLTEFHASHLAFSLLNGFKPPGLSVFTSPTDPYLKYLYKASLLSLEVSFPPLKKFVISSAANSKF